MPFNVGGDVVLGADFVEHAQYFFIGAAVQRAGKGRGGRRRRHKGVGLRAAHGAHGVGAAVLLVVGVQDKENVERARQHGIGLVFGLGHLPQHVHEVFACSSNRCRDRRRGNRRCGDRYGGDGGDLADKTMIW